ncbi:MAG: isoprenylcysteine carboxylmethyltransferase family protein [Candidatus Acidiferrales bacterium]
MATPWVTRWRVRAGYPLSILYLWLASPTFEAIAIGAAIAVAGLCIRAAAAGNLRKHETLTTAGPYAWTRNPLYLGSSLLATGFAVAGHSIWAALVIAIYFFVFYPAVMKREEGELRIRYGAAFDAYAKQVPLFWPRPPKRSSAQGAPRDSGGFSWNQYCRNREYQAALGVLFAIVLVWLQMKMRH